MGERKDPEGQEALPWRRPEAGALRKAGLGWAGHIWGLPPPFLPALLGGEEARTGWEYLAHREIQHVE